MRWEPIFPSPGSSDPTMERFPILDWSGLGIYLHRFKGSRQRPIIASHDHPWDFAFLVLRGGYEEVVCRCAPIPRERGSFGFRLATSVHSIRINPEGCLTLCVRGPVRREWGWRSLRG